MEPTFYDDARFGPLKRPSSLDLGGGPAKRAARGNALLTSPDLHMLKLESPELEKLIIQQHGAPHQACLYQKGGEFPDALEPAYPLYQPQPTAADGAYGYQHHPQQHQNAAACYATPPGGAYYAPVKEEPQTVPSCAPSPPPRSPIDMADQERLKLERKRLRNRIAASKCRRRKLERIARLEDKVAHLKGENAELTGHVTRLKEHVCRLKQQVMEHVRAGCEILVAGPCHPSQPFEHDL